MSQENPLKGYCLPITPEGRSSIMDAPPWHYGGNILQVLFRTDVSEVKRLVPPPLKPGPDPGLGLVWFVEWISVSDSNPELVFINPERTQYKECLVAVSCQHDGEAGFTVP